MLQRSNWWFKGQLIQQSNYFINSQEI